MGERIKLADARRDITDAFNEAVASLYWLGVDEAADAIAARERVFAFLAQAEDDRRQIEKLAKQRDLAIQQRDHAIGQRDEANGRLHWRNERADHEHGDLRSMLQRVLDEPNIDSTLRNGIERLLANTVE